MWEIYEHKKSVKHIGALPNEILKRYEKWKDIVAISGPAGLKQIKGFHDEALRGEWKGYRSSRLNIQYRIIYKIESAAHQEFNNSKTLNAILSRLKNNEDLLGRSSTTIFRRKRIAKLRKIRLNSRFPKYIVENQHKYRHLIYVNN